MTEAIVASRKRIPLVITANTLEKPSPVQEKIEGNEHVFVNTLEESIKLLRNLGYRKIEVKDPTTGKEVEDKIGFVRRIENGDYPRSHIILKQSTFEIITFHIDISEHKAFADSSKDSEIRLLIERLGKEKKGIAQSKLLQLFRDEQLFGSIREENLIGKTQQERLHELLRMIKQRRLIGGDRHAWKSKGQTKN